MINTRNIRNFSVISHIDHGKTTLTDRFLEITKTIVNTNIKKEKQDRLLDSNPIEQERGITIKLAPVRMLYKLGNQNYILNLIDTPGHVDFAYEVSRSLAACEGALLLVDASQGIQAQTIANAHQAINQGLELIPVINKIDLHNAQIQKTLNQLEQTFGFKKQEIILVSAKTGENVDILLQEIIKKIPSPKHNEKKELKALVFNSFYDEHKGVIAYIRIFSKQVSFQQKLQLFSNKVQFIAEEVGYFIPDMKKNNSLLTGQVGYIATGLKDISLCRAGDTITTSPIKENFKPLPGYKNPQPMVFLDLYTIENKEFPNLKKALNKLQLTDSSLQFKPVLSQALGSGFKIGFQGLLHADITQERLEREFDLELIAASPSVEYKVTKTDGTTLNILTPSKLPEKTSIKNIYEPYVKMTIFVPMQYIGPTMKLCQQYHTELIKQEHYIDSVYLVYKLPLRELISGFFNKLKSVSSGFASIDWKFLDYQKANIIKLDVLINYKIVEPLSILVPEYKEKKYAKDLVFKLKKLIPRQQFQVAIQIAKGAKILARQNIQAYKKDVTAKLYGGDQTRKDKLLKKQKKGKKRLKRIGQISLPQKVFLQALDIN